MAGHHCSMDTSPSNPNGLSALTAAEAHNLINELPGALDEYEGLEDVDKMPGRASKLRLGHKMKSTMLEA